MTTKLNPYFVVFVTVCIGLAWRPFLIGFYGDDYSITQTDSFVNAFIYDGGGRRERILYALPIAIPRYLFGHEPIGWGIYAVILSGLTAIAVCSYFKAVLSRLDGLENAARPAAILAATLFIFMPWSLTPVLWNTNASLLVMVGLLALAGMVSLSSLSLALRTILFTAAFSSASLIYESIWCAWIPLLLIKLALDTPAQRRDTMVMFAASLLAQAALVANYLPSYGLEGRVKLDGDLAIGYKAQLFLENLIIRLPFEVVSSMGVIGLATIPLVLFVLIQLVKRRKTFTNTKFMCVLAACGAGIVGGVFIISIGNYRVAGTTEEGRTMFVLSFWMAFIVALTAAVLMTKNDRPWTRARTAGLVIVAMIVTGFYLRAGDWVRGYFYQREIIAAAPAEEIARVADGERPLLLVEFDTPLHLFHGMHNNRGTNFLAEDINRRTGKNFFAFPATGRLHKTVLDETHLYQVNCIKTSEIVSDYAGIFAPKSMVFWNAKTGEVRKVTSPFSYGCTRKVRPYESLGELLYPFMGNPRRF